MLFCQTAFLQPILHMTLLLFSGCHVIKMLRTTGYTTFPGISNIMTTTVTTCNFSVKLGIDEWLVRLVQSMYKDVRSRVRVGDGYSEEFGVGVGVHQGSVLSPLLFIIVLEALSREFRTGCPWELLYADDLMISAESMEELLVKVKTWKTEMEKKGLRVNIGKTKIMESGINLDVLKKSGKYPCGPVVSV